MSGNHDSAAFCDPRVGMAEGLANPSVASPIAGIAIVSSARTLARLIAGTTDMSADDAMRGLCSLNDNLLPLLASPEGWVALSEVVASITGCDPVRRLPTRH